MSSNHSPSNHSPSGAESISQVEAQLSVLFNSVRTLWRDSARRVHPSLQPVGYKLLATLVRHGSCTAGALGEELATDKSVISRQVKLLEELGLVQSTPDPADGRARILTPTPKAVQCIAEVRDENQAQLRARLGGWSDDELSQFAVLLGRLSA